MRERPDGLLEAESFAEHMAPGVRWIEDPDFTAAFAAIAGADTMTTEAAYTRPGVLMPAYVNVQMDVAGDYILTVRGEARGGKMGETVVMTVPQDDWHQLIADAARLRPSESWRAPADRLELPTGSNALDIDIDLDRELDQAEQRFVADRDAGVDEGAEAAGDEGQVLYNGPQGDPWPGAKPGLPEVGEVTGTDTDDSARDRAS